MAAAYNVENVPVASFAVETNDQSDLLSDILSGLNWTAILDTSNCSVVNNVQGIVQKDLAKIISVVEKPLLGIFGISLGNAKDIFTKLRFLPRDLAKELVMIPKQLSESLLEIVTEIASSVVCVASKCPQIINSDDKKSCASIEDMVVQVLNLTLSPLVQLSDVTNNLIKDLAKSSSDGLKGVTQLKVPTKLISNLISIISRSTVISLTGKVDKVIADVVNQCCVGAIIPQ